MTAPEPTTAELAARVARLEALVGQLLAAAGTGLVTVAQGLVDAARQVMTGSDQPGRLPDREGGGEADGWPNALELVDGCRRCGHRGGAE